MQVCVNQPAARVKSHPVDGSWPPLGGQIAAHICYVRGARRVGSRLTFDKDMGSRLWAGGLQLLELLDVGFIPLNITPNPTSPSSGYFLCNRLTDAADTKLVLEMDALAAGATSMKFQHLMEIMIAQWL